MEDYFKDNGGAVLSTTFDKYCYVNVRHLPRFFDYSTELSYFKTERVNNVNEIQHPAIREAMKMLDMQEIRLTYEADLPARSGLGTSSSFAVGMLNAFYALKGKYLFSKKVEDRVIQQSSTLVFLHSNDEQQMKTLYDVKCNCKIIPVCIDRPKFLDRHVYCERVKMLITGSLWFGGNYDGIKWMIENVLPKLDVEYELTIAGRNPTPSLVELCSRNSNIKLVISPVNMSAYFENTDIVLAPIFDGAGMKVKVAEALSYGKPVIGTSHAFVGYKIENGVNSYLADTEDEFIDCIKKYMMLNIEDKTSLRNSVIELFNKHYSLESSILEWRGELDKAKCEF